ncbi:hypothetical protein HZB69_00760 [Candidatus Amesbacteria bacterium]|nr:hypothetical protein [Candidatus Amesbacteria bacterium]
MNSPLFDLLNLTFLDIVKWMFVVGLVIYAVFAVIIVRQVKVMSEAVDSDANSLFQIMSWLHLLMAVLLVAFAIVIL